MSPSRKQAEHLHSEAGARQGTPELRFREGLHSASILMQGCFGLWCFP